ncbi:DUF3788 domain-containing protein [uncultured Robinsoniella sp.]|uniref:DUF3788 domain-containing protein n=1 Tax=uncultured Robinsoniella sp. TaxID=904190 RepID=UPI00374F3E94
MAWDTLYPKTTVPTFNQIGAYIQNPLWNKLHACLTQKYAAIPKIEYSCCSLRGWNIKYKKKGKTLCTIYPQEGWFKILVIASERQQVELEFFIQTCCPNIQKAYENTKFFNGGKWLFLDISDSEILKDLLELIHFRTL